MNTLETSLKMSDHRCVFNSLFFFCVICLCIQLSICREKRYTEADICPTSQKTLENVKYCPGTVEEYKDRSDQKNCNSSQLCAGVPLIYHCVLSGDTPVEICAPRALISGKCCYLYNEKLGRVIEDYNRPCSMCPFQYNSDESEYGIQCGKSGNNKQTTTINSDGTSGDNNSKQENGGEMDTMILIAIVLGGVTLFCPCLWIICHCRRKCLNADSFRHEHRQENNYHKKDSKLDCFYCRGSTESCEIMIKDSENSEKMNQNASLRPNFDV